MGLFTDFPNLALSLHLLRMDNLDKALLRAISELSGQPSILSGEPMEGHPDNEHLMGGTIMIALSAEFHRYAHLEGVFPLENYETVVCALFGQMIFVCKWESDSISEPNLP
jgi:hypothetical protein